jgi:hypothetical protein
LGGNTGGLCNALVNLDVDIAYKVITEGQKKKGASVVRSALFYIGIMRFGVCG